MREARFTEEQMVAIISDPARMGKPAQMIDSTHVTLGSGWKRGEQKQAVGRSRGGRNTKISRTRRC